MKIQTDNRIFVYRIDSDNRIIHVNNEWLEFAIENDEAALNRNAILGCKLLSYIQDKNVQLLWSSLIDKVRTTASTLEIPFRCDSPDKRRYMHMELHPLDDDNVEFRSVIHKIETRKPIRSLVYRSDEPAGFCVMCSWCKKVHLGKGRWAEVEEAIRSLDLFGDGLHIGARNSVCPSCFNGLTQS